jgi:small subunit ribosomal protein S23
MVRRIASQVHKQASRLTRAGLIKTPPVWYQAVLEHPPLPLPPREPPSRTSYDSAPPKEHSFNTKKTPGPRPLAVNYIEDDIRRQFFRDHPFESFRPRTLTEAGAIEDEHPINGLQWTRLNQRGRNPSPEEYVSLPHLTYRAPNQHTVTQRRAVRAESAPGTRPHAQRRVRRLSRAVSYAASRTARRNALRSAAGDHRARRALWAIRDFARLCG